MTDAKLLTLEALHLSQAAYLRPPDKALSHVSRYGYHEVLPHSEAGGVQSYTFIRGEQRVMSVRGTELPFTWREFIKDWCTNLNFWRTRAKVRGKVHRGFYEGAKRLEVVVMTRPTVVVGHSQGGAIALAWAFRSKARLEVHTFGAPRVFNYWAARWMATHHNVDQWALRGDPVTKVPPGLLGWWHVSILRIGRRFTLTKADHPTSAYERALNALAG